MLGQTFYSLAIYGDWTPDTIGVARWILFGLVAQLGSFIIILSRLAPRIYILRWNVNAALTARSWWHDESAPEWPAFAQLIKAIEMFVFFLPEQQRSPTGDSPLTPLSKTPAGSPATPGKSLTEKQRKSTTQIRLTDIYFHVPKN